MKIIQNIFFQQFPSISIYHEKYDDNQGKAWGRIWIWIKLLQVSEETIPLFVTKKFPTIF